MNRMLITGASGLLGLNLGLSVQSEEWEVVGTANESCLRNLPFKLIQKNLLDSASAAELMEEVQPDAVIHCAAIANVDECEKNPQRALFLNGIFPGMLAAETAERGIPLIHISTDAVFDGTATGENAYRETDTPAPINVYAASKLAGEKAVADFDPNAIIARVNFYGWSASGSRSLCEFFYNNLKAGNEIFGFQDVFFNPLYVGDLARILMQLLNKNASGVYHVFSSESISKYEFGCLIAERFGFDKNLIRPTSWREAGLSAARSPNLRMNTEKLQNRLNEPMPDQAHGVDQFFQSWQAGLHERIQSFASAC